jgi:ATP-dependent Clp protease protease subunit
MSHVPYVIEKNEKGEKVYDLYSRLLKDRIVFISGSFNGEMANSVVAQLLFLEANSPEKDIYMYINSPGGQIDAMYAIYDTMQYVSPDIMTIGFGQVASAGSFILAAGTKGKRYALPNTEIMIHELRGGATGPATDLEIGLKHALKIKEKMASHYAKMTGRSLKKIKKDMERDYHMSPEEAKEYGLIDNVQYKRVGGSKK